MGLVRKDNEDNYLVSLERGLFVVADGMGGHVGGRVASSLAVQVLDREIRGLCGQEPGTQLQAALLKANEVILYQGQADTRYAGMGTTVTAVLVKEERLYLAHIGDSRAYLYRDGMLSLLTRDHSLVNELFQNGSLTMEEMKKHPQRNILTRALGTQQTPQIDLSSTSLKKGDLILLCTDGLHNQVAEQDLLLVLGAKSTLKEKLRQMVNIALQKGGSDNITAILVCYE